LGQTTAICGDLVCYRTRQGPLTHLGRFIFTA
jgi:hypothetical protein